MLRDEVPLDQIKTARLVELLAWWNARRGTRSMPSRTDFEVGDLKPWLGNIHLLDVEEGGAEFRYRVYGSHLAQYFGKDFTGMTTAVVREASREIVRSEYGAVVRERRPMLVQRDRSIAGRDTPVERLILPLSSDGVGVDKLLVGAYPVRSQAAT
jgi:hypothetical protein